MKRDERKKAKLIDDVLLSMESMSVNKACAEHGVAPSTFKAWVRESKPLSAQYARARSLYCDRLADEIMEICDEEVPTDNQGRSDNAIVQQRRLQVDTRKWLLSKLKPGTYGDRLTLAGDDEAPLAIVEVKRTIVKSKASKTDADKISNEDR